MMSLMECGPGRDLDLIQAALVRTFFRKKAEIGTLGSLDS